MKKIVFIPIFLLAILASAFSNSPKDHEIVSEGIQFETGSWSETLALAKKENKLVFLDIYASWCGPCKMLKSRTFPNAEVGTFYNANFINYALDAEKGEGIPLASKFNVTAYPTLLFVDGDGNLIAKTMGFHNPSALLDVGKQIIKAY